MLNKKGWQDLAERALWTFVQAGGAVFLTGLAVSMNQVQLKALLVASFAAGISAVKTYVKTTI